MTTTARGTASTSSRTAWPRPAHGRRAHPSEPAVVQADVRLEDCMDLKDSVGLVPLLAQAHDEVLRISPEQGLPLPRQTGSTHRLDGVVEVTVAILERDGIRIRAVRAVFAEGAPSRARSQRGIPRPARRPRHCLIGNVDVVPAGFLGPAPPPRAAGATANAVSPVVDPEDAGETMRRYFGNASDGDLADAIRRAARQPQQVDR
jgi:hypothetical protein